MKLKVDPKRIHEGGTGLCVRAELPSGGFGSADIVSLDKRSLLEWLRSRGGDNPLAEDVVGILLDHGHLHGRKRESK